MRIKKITKPLVVFMVLLVSFFNIQPNYAFAAGKEVDENKLTGFISSCLESGYINLDIKIESTNKKDFYYVHFLYKENISGMDFGFYLYPNMIDTLNLIGVPHVVGVENQYAIIKFIHPVENIQEFLTELSILPFIDFEVFLEKKSKETIIKAHIQEDFFKEERKKNKLIDDILGTNIYTVSLERAVPSKTTHNSSLVDDEGNPIWIYSHDLKQTEIAAILERDSFLIYHWKHVLIGIVILIVLLIVFIAYKKLSFSSRVKKRKKNNYNDYDNDNDYNDYNNSGYTDYNNDYNDYNNGEYADYNDYDDYWR